MEEVLDILEIPRGFDKIIYDIKKEVDYIPSWLFILIALLTLFLAMTFLYEAPKEYKRQREQALKKLKQLIRDDIALYLKKYKEAYVKDFSQQAKVSMDDILRRSNSHLNIGINQADKIWADQLFVMNKEKDCLDEDTKELLQVKRSISELKTLALTNQNKFIKQITGRKLSCEGVGN